MSDFKSFDRAARRRLIHYIRERQRVALRRASGQRPPWTDDPVLREYHFTNVYREMDPGTAYARRIIYADRPANERLFNLMVYRMVGREETHEALGWLHPPPGFDRDHFVDTIHAIQDADGSAYTGSYMVNGYHWMGTRDKAENIARLIEELGGVRPHYKTGERLPGWEAFWNRVNRAGSREEVHAAISGANGWGGFLAYQVMVDMSYPAGEYRPSPRHVVPSFGDNDGWVFLGTGARKGLDLVAGRRVPRAQHQDVITALRGEVNDALEAEGFGWLTPETSGRPLRLTKANLLNCLCEVFKYDRALEGGTRPRMGFDAMERWTDAQGDPQPGFQWDIFDSAGIEVE